MTALAMLAAVLGMSSPGAVSGQVRLSLATFEADVTCPVGHPLLGGLRQPAATIEDPLSARGLVILGPEQPIVLCAVDWCEIRNDSYDAWRDALAGAAGTTRERVLVCALHQHDAPLSDRRAAELLAETNLAGEMFDPEFETACIEGVADALRRSLADTQPVSHIGTGEADVERLASSRRVVRDDGSVTYGRGSSSGGDEFYRNAPEGPIDPALKTLSFWNGEQPLAAVHAYATHPMSYYGGGGVSADFVGLARRLMQRDHPDTFQIYVSGCSGDVTAGKYNDGSPSNRAVLAGRLHDAMQRAWDGTERTPVADLTFRNTDLELPFRESDRYTLEAMQETVAEADADKRQRILAAMGVASRERLVEGRPIEMPCVDFGTAQIVLFPGESFVGYQIMARDKQPESFVMSIGYGECWPGYIPTQQGFDDSFNDVWFWVAPGSPAAMEAAVERVLIGRESSR